MKPATNLHEVVPGLWAWSALHEEWNVEFSACAWATQEGLALVDPIELDHANLARLSGIARPSAILLTNQNHERDADAFRRRYGIPIYAHRDAVPGIEVTPDRFFVDGDALPGGLTAIHLPGTCPSESGFHHSVQGGVLLLGDIFLNGKEGLRFLPDTYCQNAAQSRESARRLLRFKFETLTVAHGNPIHPGALQRVRELLENPAAPNGV